MSDPAMLTENDALRLLASLEDDVQHAVDRAVRSFLRQARVAALETVDLNSLVADATGQRLALGDYAVLWETEVSDKIVEEVFAAYQAAYTRHAASGTVTQLSGEAAQVFLAGVRDRLVRGITPPIAEDAFDKVRVATAEGLAQGWSRPQLSARLAADLGWETDGAYWRAEKQAADDEIDAILDSFGRPGDPVREMEKRTDPRIKELRATRNRAIAELDREEAYWRTRANRIARTESTGATGFGAERGLVDEGVTHKRWVATHDARTRESHAAAHGQIVPVDESFLVGGWALSYPGDPAGPAEAVINCRCCIVGTTL